MSSISGKGGTNWKLFSGVRWTDEVACSIGARAGPASGSSKLVRIISGLVVVLKVDLAVVARSASGLNVRESPVILLYCATWY